MIFFSKEHTSQKISIFCTSLWVLIHRARLISHNYYKYVHSKLSKLKSDNTVAEQESQRCTPQKRNTDLLRHSLVSKCCTIYRERGTAILSMSTKWYDLPCDEFYKAHKCLIPLPADRWYRISPKSDNKCWKIGLFTSLREVCFHWSAFHATQ